MVKLINNHFAEVDCGGFAFRLKQSHFFTQFIDVLVDSADPLNYLGIECKSFTPPKTEKLYFSKFTVSKKGEHQVTRISEFIEKTGRFGVLALELRGTSRGPNLNTIFLVPWAQVKAWYEDGEKYIDPEWLAENEYPQLKKVDGVLNWVDVTSRLRQL